ncbi:MAG: MFS transporter, partial [Pedobacter sp.]|nr:MFS transporter [Pedobacter sp.]
MLRPIVNAYRISFSGLSRESWLLSVVILFNRCGYMAVPFMGLYVTQSLHRSESDAGIIISLFGLGAILGTTAGGKLTDMFGFRPVQIFSSLIGGALFLSFAVIENFHMLCLLAIVISFFYDAFRPANFTAIAAYAAEGKETRSYSLNRLATNIGWSVGISLAGIIASFNYKLLFVVDGVVSILVGIAIFFFLPAIKGYRKKVKEQTKGLIVQKPWQDGWFVRLIFLTTIFASCFFLMFRVVPVFFKEEWHMGESTIGIVLGLNGIIIALLEMVMISKIENRRTGIYYVVLGVFIVALAFAALMLP